METKLDLVLKSFSEEEIKPRNFRRDTIILAGKKLKAIKAIKDLNKAQRYLNLLGGVDNLSDVQVDDVFYLANKGAVSNLNFEKEFDLYIPKKDRDRIQVEVDEIERKYPLDKYKKGTPEYELNEYMRDSALEGTNIQKARALLKYAKLSNTKKKLKGFDPEDKLV